MFYIFINFSQRIFLLKFLWFTLIAAKRVRAWLFTSGLRMIVYSKRTLFTTPANRFTISSFSTTTMTRSTIETVSTTVKHSYWAAKHALPSKICQAMLCTAWFSVTILFKHTFNFSIVFKCDHQTVLTSEWHNIIIHFSSLVKLCIFLLHSLCTVLHSVESYLSAFTAQGESTFMHSKLCQLTIIDIAFSNNSALLIIAFFNHLLQAEVQNMFFDTTLLIEYLLHVRYLVVKHDFLFATRTVKMTKS